jgi:hypothetical protein
MVDSGIALLVYLIDIKDKSSQLYELRFRVLRFNPQQRILTTWYRFSYEHLQCQIEFKDIAMFQK